MASIDLLTVGEAMLRLSVPAGELLADSPRFDTHVAGAECNVAVGVAQMGYRSRWWSRMTNNVFGQRIARTLSTYGVDCSEVVWTPEDRVGTYYVEFGASPHPTRVVYDRAHSAATRMAPETFPLNRIAEVRMVHLTGITAALSDSCYALLEAVITACERAHVPVVFDVNFRSRLWSAEMCRSRLAPLLPRVNTVIVGLQDAATVFEITGEPVDVLARLADVFPVEHIALTLGDSGAMGFNRANQEQIAVGGYSVQMVDRIGAGDAFAAGVICGLLQNDFGLGLRYGVAMSALQLTIHGDLFRLTASDVHELLAQGVAKRPIR